MMAKLQIGEVLLTTRMGDIFKRLGYSVLAGYIAFGKFHSKGEMIQARHPRGVRK